MEAPKVVRIQRKQGVITQNCDLYIGRRWTLGGWNLKQSKWANPFSLSQYSREECLSKYENHIRNSSLLNDLHELQGLTLGCFCHNGATDPPYCHGDVLVKLFHEKYIAPK